METLPAESTTVLVVEDDPTLRSTLAFNLTREGFHVLTAENGSVAIEHVDRHRDNISLVILDLMIPVVPGLEVLRHIRAHYDIAVLILSARGEEQDKIDGLELGADDYVVKPFALRELLARIRATIRRHGAPATRPPGTLYRGGLQIEPDRHRATVGATELQLRPKEFGLLVTLTLEPGRVFKRQELLDRIWGDDIVVDERTVDVHISWLRAKLIDAGLTDASIRTVYGTGYRFVLDARTPDQTVLADDGVRSRGDLNYARS